MSQHLLMPKATAVWLVENTALTFDQIGAFCGLHDLEVQGIADGEVATGMQGLDPIVGGQLSWEEIERCQKDPSARLELLKKEFDLPSAKKKGPKYTPISKRQDKPDGIAYLLKNHPEMSDAMICKLIGTTKPTINNVRDRTHWNSQNIRPRHPVQLGLCSVDDFEEALQKAPPQNRPVEEPADQPADGDDKFAFLREMSRPKADDDEGSVF
ncbi:MAG: DUF1013 domain-containing protein [Alphaproteobacteria bacterium]|nr:DUF1013 domain-containing protein [Alphaproteobacteria bacterium]